jgi:hypothetical protein
MPDRVWRTDPECPPDELYDQPGGMTAVLYIRKDAAEFAIQRSGICLLRGSTGNNDVEVPR